MQIAGDNRVISHFFKDKDSSVYTIIYDPRHTLRERCDILDELVVDMKTALREEDRLKVEHKESKSELTFEKWIQAKQEKAQAEQKAKAQEVKEIPIGSPKITLPVEDAVAEEVKKD